MELTGLNCNGNPLNPLPGVGPKHADDLRRTIRLAGLLGVKHVVTMSGTPGSDPDAKYPSWVVNPWDGVYMDVLDYQWGVAAEFWTEIDALARENDVRVAIEMHPHNLVFSPVTLRRLVDLVGATNVGAEMDPSHLMWQGMDVVGVHPLAGPAGVPRRGQGRDDLPERGHPRRAGHLVHRVPGRRARTRCPPATGSGATPGRPSRAGSSSRSGSGTTSPYWTEFLTALAEVDPDCAVNIEHEDASYSQLEGLALAAKNLHAAAAAR